MADVIWSPDVVEQLAQIGLYLTQFDVAAADSITARLFDAGNSLADFPDRGRPASNATRELVTVPPYVIRYEVVDDRVTILSIRHGRRLPLVGP